MRILLADEQNLLRAGLRSILPELSPQALFFDAGTFDEALSVAADAGGVDMALLGNSMPGMNGTAGIGAFLASFPIAKVVLLTTDADPGAMLAAVAAGAVGVIFKTISGPGMLSALRLVMSGEGYLPSETVVSIAKLAARSETVGEPCALVKTRRVVFSPAESEVVPLLLDGLPNKVIAKRLGIEEAAIKARLRGMYKKMGVSNRAQAVWALLSDGRIRSG